jgi:hypothetical protein
MMQRRKAMSHGLAAEPSHHGRFAGMSAANAGAAAETASTAASYYTTSSLSLPFVLDRPGSADPLAHQRAVKAPTCRPVRVFDVRYGKF